MLRLVGANFYDSKMLGFLLILEFPRTAIRKTTFGTFCNFLFLAFGLYYFLRNYLSMTAFMGPYPVIKNTLKAVIVEIKGSQKSKLVAKD
jgi:hypothetical protein